MTRVQINRLHPDDYRLWSVVEGAVWRLVNLSKMRLDFVSPTSKKESIRAYGFCHVGDGFRAIELSLRSWEKGKWGTREPAYLYLQTIAHEVAHLRHQDHSNAWFTEYIRLLNLAVSLNLLVDIQRELG